MSYSEEIYKCSKCGLCQAVCPVFEATGNESTVSRGKFTLLSAVLSGKIIPDKDFSKYLDLCLGCNACYEYCPSGISVEEIMVAAKNYNLSHNKMPFIKKFIISNFNSKLKLQLLKLGLALYKRFGFVWISQILARSFKQLDDYAYLFNATIKENLKYKKMPSVKEKSDKLIVYFPGCINTYVNSGVKKFRYDDS
ncbi:MAG: (Fe-S)-binding protein [Bacillus subtilis]|nr:(Fe-S)-binding protein [Bacillus subtilis]